MNSLTTWNPFRDIDALANRLLGTAGTGACDTSRRPWTPSVDVTEDESGYKIVADLPEVPKDAVKVTLEEDVLTLRGERKWEKKSENTKVHLIERSYGSFTRSFRLPPDADGTKVGASYKDGVLTVTLPRKEEAKPKEVEVKVS